MKGLDAVYVRPDVEFTPYKSVLLDRGAGRVRQELAKELTAAAPASRAPDCRGHAEDQGRPRGTDARGLPRRSSSSTATRWSIRPRKTRCTCARPSSTCTSTRRITSDPGITRTYTTSSGSHDAGARSARRTDRPTAGPCRRRTCRRHAWAVQFEWTTKATNTNAARRIMQEWAKQAARGARPAQRQGKIVSGAACRTRCTASRCRRW